MAMAERSERGAVSPSIGTAYVAVAALFTASVLVQAFLAGRGLYSDIDLIDVHGVVGNAVFLLAIGQLTLGFAATKGAAGRAPLVGLGAAIVVLTITQIGLGYSARDVERRELAGWHILNGVLIFGLASAHLALAAGRRR